MSDEAQQMDYQMEKDDAHDQQAPPPSVPPAAVVVKKKIYAAGKAMFQTNLDRDWRGLMRFKELGQACNEPLAERLKRLK